MKMLFLIGLIWLLCGCTSEQPQTPINTSSTEVVPSDVVIEARPINAPSQDLYDLVDLNVSCTSRDTDDDGKMDALRVNIKPLRGWRYELVPIEGRITITASTLVPLTSTVFEKGSDVYDAEYKINSSSFKEGQGYWITLKYTSISNYSKYLPDYGVISARFVSPGGIILEGGTSTIYTECVLRKPTQEVPAQYVQ